MVVKSYFLTKPYIPYIRCVLFSLSMGFPRGLKNGVGPTPLVPNPTPAGHPPGAMRPPEGCQRPAARSPGR